jgi:hypothetical protein
MTKIDHVAAERLRILLSDLQDTILNDGGVSARSQERLIEWISTEGFGLVDTLEDVVR